MTFLCAPITVESQQQAMAEALAARAAGADLVEYRVDGFITEDDDTDLASSISDVVNIVADSPLPCIVTCRIAAEGGAYEGDDGVLARLLEALISADHPPQYIDVELATIERSTEIRSLAARLAEVEAPRLIVSMHDFNQRPADLTRRQERVAAVKGAAVLKLAFRARSLRDNLELFEILQTRDIPTIALGMGEFGVMSRVLAPKFGAFLTFAALRSEAATAPGQPTIGELTTTYQFRSINRKTQVFGVIGWPVSQSMSPAIHNAGFASIEFNGVYLPLPIPPEWEHFKATLGALIDDPRLDFRGASVTIPHKEHLVRFAREHAEDGWRLDSLAEAAGAANTIVRDDENWFVVNTDAPAIAQCLQTRLSKLRGKRIAIIGAGGVARAAAAGLVAEGCEVKLFNRTPERAQRIADDLCDFAQSHGAAIVAHPMKDIQDCGAAVIINATPLGMTGGPAPLESPFDLSTLTQLPRECVVFETVYNPIETPLLKQARDRGYQTIDGVEMFVRQAALQFSAWTGQTPSSNLFDRIVRERLVAAP